VWCEQAAAGWVGGRNASAARAVEFSRAVRAGVSHASCPARSVGPVMIKRNRIERAVERFEIGALGPARSRTRGDCR